MFKSLIKNVLPFLGGIVGGPVGAIATKAIGSILLPDNDNPSEIDLERAYNDASPAQIEKIKSIVSLAQIEADDRKNAREREIKLKDRMPSIITICMMVFVITITLLPFFHIIPSSNKDMIEFITGEIIGMFIGNIASYYFGSIRKNTRN